MTQKSIARQIEVIREVTAKAAVSKEAAIAFLSRAGIKETPKITPGNGSSQFIGEPFKESASASVNQKSHDSLASKNIK